MSTPAPNPLAADRFAFRQTSKNQTFRRPPAVQKDPSTRTLRSLAAAILLALLPGPELAADPALTAALGEAQERSHLPLGFALAVSDRLRLHYHDFEPFGLAQYARAPLPLLEELAANPPGGEEPGAAAAPAGDRPTIYLYAPAYRRDGVFLPVAELPVDAAEYLFNALAVAWFELAGVAREPAFAGRLTARAELVFARVPAAHRLEAYRRALADFASHALVVASQLERSFVRQGVALCAKLDRPHTLFALWGDVFGAGRYTGSYFLPGKRETAGTWIETDVAIAAEDKALASLHLLGGVWKGERRQDLAARYCPA